MAASAARCRDVGPLARAMGSLDEESEQLTSGVVWHDFFPVPTR